ncbi:MAG: ribonuclease P protein component [Candidatus Yanofskybacteria bacterium RIFCSPHIGHO2_01_FULL_45_42]|uniref:Ribonuclease P protein component n=2 Tax=Candidatus Yanofskyibacteriota TaxID=1752733 RepID=A0A1F8H536_9BACT|nr:MAG: ribonuclease P protein component [Candidatus Yanofskybacteria bacterium RIFCSPHIGHO2_01_FULL_45_42]OGN26636.1 MAG: ribonuclease P protein component [Candidatus Yanofskybacteria bacterium RIFCSPLOWO2_01_FULL_45_72]OGN31979.1 MAG: ribonuclease P protein component [Candidatus Yanofskybacteria bacterium RIFCSPLOWO2_02_FULL_45_18]
MALPLKNRLKTERDFKNVFRKGKTVSSGLLFCKILQKELAASRFGFIVPARKFPLAVGRNKIKRILSEAVLAELPNIREGWDIIVGLQDKHKNREELIADLVKVLRKAGLIK